MIRRVNHLSPGDTIGIYSPSSGIETGLMENYMRGKNLLIKHGYKVIEAPNTFSWEAHYSSSGLSKAKDFLSLLRNHEVKAILPTIGGTTAYQILPFLRWNDIINNPKMIFGFSDNSLQTSVITNRTGLVTFHGHSDIVFGLGDLTDKEKMKSFTTRGEYTKKYFFDTIEGRIRPGLVTKATQWKVLRSGTAMGTLIGGNLDVLDILLGTPYALDFNDVIFFWELAYQELHRLDLLLAKLALSGVLSQIKGMIIGKSTYLNEEFFAEKHESFEEIVLRHCKPYKFPIISDADIGHDMECCMLPVGIQAKLEGDSLYLLESPYN